MTARPRHAFPRVTHAALGSGQAAGLQPREEMVKDGRIRYTLKEDSHAATDD